MKKLNLILALMLSIALVLSGCSKKEETPKASDAAPASTSAPAEKKYQYYTAEETKAAIEKNADMILLDIQVKDEWDAHHIKGAIPTHAYPVKTDEERAKLEKVLPQLEGSKPIVVVCPGGAGGAQRTIDYLTSKGIKAERLFILQNGQSKWPYAELLEK